MSVARESPMALLDVGERLTMGHLIKPPCQATSCGARSDNAS